MTGETLGLCVNKQYVLLMSGTVRKKDEVGNGSKEKEPAAWPRAGA